MKKILVVGILSLATAGLFAQGTVNFANVGTWGSAAIIDSTTGSPVGAGFVAQLYAGADANSLAPVGDTAAVIANVGFVNGGQRIIPGVPGGQDGFFQVKAWNGGFATYEEALVGDPASIMAGESTVFSVATADPNAVPPPPPAALSTMQSFQVLPVPEPSTILLGLFGAGLLLFRRRK
jgi:hypothetical protein